VPRRAVPVPLVAHGAAAERADDAFHRGEALHDAVLELAEGQPPLLAHEVVEAPAQRRVHLAVEVEEGPPEARGEPLAQRGLPRADQAGEVDIHRAAASRAAWISSGKA
jgi:hypothetical protein